MANRTLAGFIPGAIPSGSSTSQQTLGGVLPGASVVTTAATASAAFRVGGAAGMDAAAGTESEQVAFRVGGAAGLLATPLDVEQVAFRVGGAAGLDAEPATGVRVRFRVGAAGGVDAALDVAAMVRFRVGGAAGVTPDVVTRAAVRFRVGATAGMRDGYVGPGTGVVVIGPVEPLAHLREGDRQQVILPWAYIAGASGVVRVLTRTITDERGRPEFGDPLFIPARDPATRRKAGRGVLVRHNPPRRGSVAGHVRDHERALERIRRR